MTERPVSDRRSPASGLHLQISRLLMVAVVAAIAATGALIATLLTQMPPGGRPPAPGPNGMPPPPPEIRPIVVFVLVTGFFVLAWLGVLVIFCRDQIMWQLKQRQSEEWHALGDRIAEMATEYAERRETDGYLQGMRAAAAADAPEANVRAFRRTPPQR
jgi:hypothetical protein